MRDYILFIDTETSGLPKNLNVPHSEKNPWPYIVQIGWVIFDKIGNEIKSEKHYVKALDFKIDPESEKIHGISEAQTIELGEERKKVLKKVSHDLKYYKPLIVGHLMEFDSHMLSLGFRRAGMKNIMKDYPKFCTMKATSAYSLAYNRNYPKLDELYQTLFKERLKNHHDALTDAKATASCFFELMKRGDITEEMIVQQQKIFQFKFKKQKNKSGCGLPVVLFVFLTVFYFLFQL